MAEDPVRLVGFNDFVNDLRKADRSLPRKVGQVTKRVATHRIVKPAQQTASQSVGGVRRLSYAGVITARAAQKSIRVALNAKKVPDAFGQEYGAKQYPQFLPWRGSGDDAGYVLNPTIRSAEPDIVKDVADGVMEAFRVAFPE